MQEEIEKKLELFSDRLRGSRGLTQSELAAKMEVSLGAVGNWESQQNAPTGPTLRRLADFFQVPLGYLLGETENREAPEKRFIHLAQDGKGILLHEGASGYATMEYAPTLSEDPETFIVILFGDAMEPGLKAGDELTVSPNAHLESGDVVFAKRTTGDLLVRIYFGKENSRCLLVAANHAVFPPLEFGREEFAFIYPVIGAYRKLKARGLYQKKDIKDGKDGKDVGGKT